MAEARQAPFVRVLSALVLAAAAVLAALAGGFAFLAVVMLLAGLLHREWFRASHPDCYRLAYGLLAACWAASMVWSLVGGAEAVLVAGLGGALALIPYLRSGRRPLMALSGYLCMVTPSLAVLYLRDTGLAPVVFLFTVVWLTDISAYAFGRMIGGPKLWPRISPGKTWAGAAAGLFAGSAAGAAVVWGYGAAGAGIVWALVAGLILSISGQLGDLAESAWKRHFNVKDSGAIIPGHGGVMDRLDSLVAAAPVMAVLEVTGGGAV